MKNEPSTEFSTELFNLVKSFLDSYQKNAKIFIYVIEGEKETVLANSCIACCFEDLAQWYIEKNPKHIELTFEKIH